MTEEEAHRIVDSVAEALPRYQLVEASVVTNIGILVDLAGDLGRQQDIDLAIATGERLLALQAPVSSARCTLHYCMANAWEIKRRHNMTQGKAAALLWHQPALERQIIHLRLAARMSDEVHVDKERGRQIYTNLGNAFSHCGRVIEAIRSWDRALDIAPNFGMALGNRGYGLEQYARRVHDPGHQGVMLAEAWHSLKGALKARGRKSVYPQARAVFRQTMERIEKHVPLEQLQRGVPQWVSQRRISRAEAVYREWCLQERLFLNDLNDLGPVPIASADVLALPSIVTGMNSAPPAFGLFNQLKQEFTSARYLYFEGCRDDAVHFADRDVALIDTLDYSTYSLSVEKVKISFRMTYALVDKMAYFLNDYLALGVAEKDVAFRTLWYERRTPKQGVRADLQTSFNPALHALFWLAKDLHERDTRYSEALEPEARQIAALRNHLEHKYVKVHEMGVPQVDQAGTARDPLHDPLAYGVGRKELEGHTLWLLRTVRAGLIYLSAAVLVEEGRRARAHPDRITGPVVLPPLPDRFKGRRL